MISNVKPTKELTIKEAERQNKRESKEENQQQQQKTNSHKLLFKINRNHDSHKKKLKEKVKILFKINEKMKYIDYKLINNIFQLKKSIKDKENIENQRKDNLNKDKIYLVDVFTKKLCFAIENLKEEKTEMFFVLLNLLILLQIVLCNIDNSVSDSDSHEIIRLIFNHETIITSLLSIYAYTSKENQSKINNELNKTLFLKQMLFFTLRNFFIEEIKEKLCLCDISLYLKVVEMFSFQNDLLKISSPKNESSYYDLIVRIYNVDFDDLNLRFKKDEDYSICKLSKVNILVIYIMLYYISIPHYTNSQIHIHTHINVLYTFFTYLYLKIILNQLKTS